MFKMSFVSENFTRYGSNITMCGKKFLRQYFGILLRSCTRKIMKIRQYL